MKEIYPMFQTPIHLLIGIMAGLITLVITLYRAKNKQNSIWEYKYYSVLRDKMELEKELKATKNKETEK